MTGLRPLLHLPPRVCPETHTESHHGSFQPPPPSRAQSTSDSIRRTLGSQLHTCLSGPVPAIPIAHACMCHLRTFEPCSLDMHIYGPLNDAHGMCAPVSLCSAFASAPGYSSSSLVLGDTFSVTCKTLSQSHRPSPLIHLERLPASNTGRAGTAFYPLCPPPWLLPRSHPDRMLTTG